MLALFIMVIVMTTTLIIISGSLIYSENTNYSLQSLQALNLAEAGVDKAVASLNATSGAYSGEDGTVLGAGQYSVVITTPDAGTKLVESTGFVPSKDNPKAKRTIDITVAKGVGVAFNYGVQVGEGGFQMANGSEIKGSIYSDGNIIMSNNAQITGDAYVAGGTAPNPDQQSVCSTYCGDFIFGTNVNGQDRLDVAQSFVPGVSDYLNKVSIRLKKQGTPPDLTLRLLGDSGGQPDQKNVIASGTLTAGLVGNEYGFVDVPFSSPPKVTAGTVYWIMLDTSEDSNNYWYWEADTMQGYTLGQAKWSQNWQAKNPIWNTPSPPLDLDFETYMGGTATYIQGSQGVTIGGDAHANTLENLLITGSAYYQVAQNISAAHSYPGSADPPNVAMPVSESNILSWESRAEKANPSLGPVNNCVATLGPGKYNGDVTILSNCTVTIEDPIWITGNLTLGNGVQFNLDPSYGPSSGVILVSGKVNISNTVTINGSGSAGSYLMMLTIFDSRPGSPTAGQIALSTSNAGTAGILYAPYGIAQINNGDKLSEISAWEVEMGTGVQITYQTGFASTFFSVGPSGAFSLVKGTYQLK